MYTNPKLTTKKAPQRIMLIGEPKKAMECFKSLSLNQRNIAGHSWISGHSGQACGAAGTTFVIHHRICLGRGPYRCGLCHWLQENSYIHYSSHSLFAKLWKLSLIRLFSFTLIFIEIFLPIPFLDSCFTWSLLCLLVLEAYRWCPLFYFLSPAHPFISLSRFLP